MPCGDATAASLAPAPTDITVILSKDRDPAQIKATQKSLCVELYVMGGCACEGRYRKTANPGQTRTHSIRQNRLLSARWVGVLAATSPNVEKGATTRISLALTLFRESPCRLGSLNSPW
jgi:hypothetical protein